MMHASNPTQVDQVTSQTTVTKITVTCQRGDDLSTVQIQPHLLHTQLQHHLKKITDSYF